jgi:hypothetical protein
MSFSTAESIAASAKSAMTISLHEEGHAYFAEKAAAADVKFDGLTMYWDSRPQYDCPAISRSSGQLDARR